ncbi:hypothetical protein GII30_00785 [Gordonia amarae]|uniref:Esterase n=2 Tax=Gordonia amarae TaxID=36821 RepID=G7GV55_9ACTN|nr:hypothetical protein [Gordonia amarae]MCS3876877.1 uncharacterized protein with LGFP repeats [Gordonia amarae]QHN15711.1 hypothetical protein GII35_00785 [Gordonia amarae]QHN20280.1 hypothetical protein GII34_00785 [Gordonia amarae]QHN29131.1 hypothetical protein GII32_00785 [Gordonia amarae]QHN37911.1 hypothetical protein GII30_00785 [Gordonia amarae]
MHQVFRRSAAAAAAIAATTLIVAGCSDDDDDNASSSATSSVSVSTDAGAGASTDAGAGASTDAGADASTDASGDANAPGGDVKLPAADGTEVSLTGAIAGKYNAATDKQKTDLGKPLTGADASGTSENGMTFQQFDGGVISSKGDTAYITWGKIRDAWNVKRDDTGAPSESGKGGSSGPLGAPTSDETDEGGLKQSTFENGKITWDPKTDTTEVTVKDKVVPAK